MKGDCILKNNRSVPIVDFIEDHISENLDKEISIHMQNYLWEEFHLQNPVNGIYYETKLESCIFFKKRLIF